MPTVYNIKKKLQSYCDGSSGLHTGTAAPPYQNAVSKSRAEGALQGDYAVLFPLCRDDSLTNWLFFPLCLLLVGIPGTHCLDGADAEAGKHTYR